MTVMRALASDCWLMYSRATAHSSSYVKVVLSVSAKRLEGPVRDPALAAAKRLLGGLAFSLLLQVVGAACGVAGDLGERNEVDDPVELAVAASVQAMSVNTTGTCR